LDAGSLNESSAPEPTAAPRSDAFIINHLIILLHEIADNISTMNVSLQFFDTVGWEI